MSYDLEPFNEQDWMALHFGMRRKVERYSPLAEALPQQGLKSHLEKMKAAIAAEVKRLPPHHHYMDRLQSYLRKNHDQQSPN